MSFRTSEDYLAASEECPPYSQPGSVLFSQPSEVDSWCQSIGFPLTPPDTASECSTSDCADMNVPSWSRTSLPAESWNTAPAPDHSTMMQAPGSDWSSHGHPVTAQDLQALDASSWLNVPHGSVDSGLSPVLSQESQSTQTLNTISEPEVPLLPPGLDLSFISEPSWDFSGPVVYSSTHAAQECSPGFVSSPECGQYPGYAAPQPAVYGPQQPMYLFQEQAPCPKRSASDPSMIQRRPLLPRTETQTIQAGQAHGTQYAVRQPHTGVVRADSAASVSSSQGPVQDTVMPAALSCQPQGPAVPFSRMSPPGRTNVSPRPDTAPPSKLVSDPSAEDFGSLIQYDPDEKTASAPPSYPPTYASAPSQTESPVDAKLQSGYQANSTTSEADEGRHRSHPLYNEGPAADGLYHCPFKSDPSCGHKPTKLKCNYDKFIDSHLKPFRCKVEACSKQEFSSTACLLRHEREAHGMHGHGDRPHLCFYPGCERGIPGNGFPRRYNLFDHMKRVHDHKDEPSQAYGGADPQGSRKAAGRKRKAASSPGEEPAAQRAKVHPMQQPTPPMALSPSGFAQQVPMYQEQHYVRQDPLRQRQLYSQWNNQRELLGFQMNTLRPDDEASLQYFSQNVEELRRLSQEARQG